MKMNKANELPTAMLKYLIGKEYVSRIKDYETKYIAAVQAEDEEFLKCHKFSCKRDIAESIGALCNVSAYTISCYGNYAMGIDELTKKNELLARQILMGETKATTRDLQKLIKAL